MELMGLGKALPKKQVTNDDLSKTLDTSDEWIVSRTGIQCRRFAQEETNASLAGEAGRQAMERAGVTAGRIGLCIVATFTADNGTPSAACMAAKELNLPESVLCFDVNAACSGFLYALGTANALLQTMEPGTCGLVIGCDLISRVLDMTDRSTCVLFGDGAGAAVVKLSDQKPFDFLYGSVPDDQTLRCRFGETRMEMQGRDVFRFAVEKGAASVKELMARGGLTAADVDHIVCHQANLRIIEALAKRVDLEREKFYTNLQRYGNTSAASIPIALCELWEEGGLKTGETVLCAGFGGGLTYGGVRLTI